MNLEVAEMLGDFAARFAKGACLIATCAVLVRAKELQQPQHFHYCCVCLQLIDTAGREHSDDVTGRASERSRHAWTA